MFISICDLDEKVVECMSVKHKCKTLDDGAGRFDKILILASVGQKKQHRSGIFLDVGDFVLRFG